MEPVDFTGTWQRETEEYLSTIFIHQSEEGIEFGWKQEAKDGSWFIDCNDQGECDKVLNGEKIEHYSFSLQLSEDKQKLIVKWIAKKIETNEIIPFIDEMEIIEGGRELMSRPIHFDEEKNKVYTGEEYRFIRVEE